jgi:hypothetical protein
MMGSSITIHYPNRGQINRKFMFPNHPDSSHQLPTAMKFIHLLLFALFAFDETPVSAVDTNRPSFRSLGAEEIGGGGAGAKITKKEDKETIEVSFPTSKCSASTLDSYDKDFTMMFSRSRR